MAFHYRSDLSGEVEPVVTRWPVGANQTIARGMLLDVSGGKAVKASNGSVAVLGVAASDKTSGANPTDADTVEVLIPTPTAVFEVDYTGTNKTSLSSADLTTAFDIVGTGADQALKINLDDTIGGMCRVVSFDNNRATAHIVFKRSALVFN